MAKMKDYAIGLAEAYEKTHPDCSWEEAMRAVCEDERPIKSYDVEAGCMGLINGAYQLFSCEREYLETLFA